MSAKGFTGFPDETVGFLKALKKNNNRDWFNANKDQYESAIKGPAEQFCDDMTMRLRRVTGVDHKAKIFRIYRDVRFSKDKTPYNTHLHITLAPQTLEASPPAWYFGLDTSSIAFGAGYIMFDKARLESFRSAVDKGEGEKLAKLLDRLRKAGARVSEPELKRVPAPFSGDHPSGELLRRKSLSAWIDIGDLSAASRSDFADLGEANFKRLKPLFSWFLMS
jgi:uncharacterized protein (TIGR02453 family)